MKYQKEFEERFFDIDDPDYLGVNPDTGKYYDMDDQMLYEGFVAGIESGIKKEEPTLLGLVSEWRKSDITDEELLNNISNKLDEWNPVSEGVTKLPKYIDILFDDGIVFYNYKVPAENSGNSETIKKYSYWRPSPIQD